MRGLYDTVSSVSSVLVFTQSSFPSAISLFFSTLLVEIGDTLSHSHSFVIMRLDDSVVGYVSLYKQQQMNTAG